MSLLRRLVAPEQRTATLAELLLELRGGSTAAGVRVTEQSAMRHAAVWACQRLIAESIAQLPVASFRRRDGVREPVEPQPELLEAPSGVLSRPEWVSQVVLSAVSSGNTFGLVAARDRLQYPSQVEVVDPNRVSVVRKGSGLPDYRVDGERVAGQDMMHVRAMTMPGDVVGMSPIEYARQAIGTGLAAEDYASGWFGKGGHPTAILKTDQQIDAPQAAEAKQRFIDATHGGGIAALGSGWDYMPVQISPEDAQFLEAQKWSVLQVAKFYGVPPEMIGASPEGSSLTYANREQRALDFVTFGLMPWIVRVESALTRFVPRGQVVKFNVSGLLRADTLTRYRAHAIGIGSQFLLPDEVRELEDRPPLPDGLGQTFPEGVSVPNDMGGNNAEGS